ncbi:MAG: hypothetical protein VX313_05780, partial [Bacteroidota bacterium]|nr:hypothetical protein [Bacteroidota bacterium]
MLVSKLKTDMGNPKKALKDTKREWKKTLGETEKKVYLALKKKTDWCKTMEITVPNMLAGGVNVASGIISTIQTWDSSNHYEKAAKILSIFKTSMAIWQNIPSIGPFAAMAKGILDIATFALGYGSQEKSVTQVVGEMINDQTETLQRDIRVNTNKILSAISDLEKKSKMMENTLLSHAERSHIAHITSDTAHIRINIARLSKFLSQGEVTDQKVARAMGFMSSKPASLSGKILLTEWCINPRSSS